MRHYYFMIPFLILYFVANFWVSLTAGQVYKYMNWTGWSAYVVCFCILIISWIIFRILKILSLVKLRFHEYRDITRIIV